MALRLSEGLGGIRDFSQEFGTKCHCSFYSFFNFCRRGPENVADLQICAGRCNVCLVDYSSPVDNQMTLLTQVPQPLIQKASAELGRGGE